MSYVAATSARHISLRHREKAGTSKTGEKDCLDINRLVMATLNAYEDLCQTVADDGR